ncbi:Glycerol-3-phosphate acyltransferase 9, variant 3, partial [Stylosanthes scabra]|nr:Glycerol-3-phosphate acyltransferase 9, variant 3 [Stylosanthes scabra]
FSEQPTCVSCCSVGHIVHVHVISDSLRHRDQIPEGGLWLQVCIEKSLSVVEPQRKMRKNNPKSQSTELELDQPNIEDYLPDGHTIHQEPRGKLRLCDLLDISPTLSEAAGAIVDDSFLRCFKSIPSEPWNWNVYLFPLWCFGVVVRYFVLFPARVLLLSFGWMIFLSAFIPVHILLKRDNNLRKNIERCLVEMICSFFVASWTGVVKYHGPRPSMRPKQVFVANHTSMIDFIVLEQMTAFAVIMQKHPGWDCCRTPFWRV